MLINEENSVTFSISNYYLSNYYQSHFSFVKVIIHQSYYLTIMYNVNNICYIIFCAELEPGPSHTSEPPHHKHPPAIKPGDLGRAKSSYRPTGAPQIEIHSLTLYNASSNHSWHPGGRQRFLPQYINGILVLFPQQKEANHKYVVKRGRQMTMIKVGGRGSEETTSLESPKTYCRSLKCWWI